MLGIWNFLVRGCKVPAKNKWAVGVDLGGTKIIVAQVDTQGILHRKLRLPTNASKGPAAVKSEVVAAVQKLVHEVDCLPVGIGVGVAGQVDARSGAVRFAPNLGWSDEPLKEDLRKALKLPVFVTNDVRAATWGEWLYGAGQGWDDLICLFVGTGIGGGVVSGGRIMTGCSNTAGELGHITIDFNGPACRCGNQGCMEALAGGWAIARQAREWVASDPSTGTFLLKLAGGRPGQITAKVVTEAAKAGDALGLRLIDRVAQALSAGVASLVNAFNPCRFILGGGVIEGYPGFVKRVEEGVEPRALAVARAPLRIVRAQLHNNAGVIGAAALALHSPKRSSGKK